MRLANYAMDTRELEQLAEKLTTAGKSAENVINNVLHGTGGQLIETEIMRLLPKSGRDWKGKAKAAADTKPFKQDNSENLKVTISSKNKYHYLYFPDDGTNTKHHIGYRGIPREFMRTGGENKSQEIIDLCVNGIVEEVENV